MKLLQSALVLVASLLLVSCQGLVTSDPLEEGPNSGAKSMTVPEHAIHYLEIVTPDAGAVRDFYSQAFGWKFSEATPELGNAYFASMPGGSLCGIRGLLSDHEKPIVRIYLRVDDIHAATLKAKELGATIALEPTEISGRGDIAIYLLGGIEQGIWQTP